MTGPGPDSRGGAPEAISDVLRRVVKGVRPAAKRSGIIDAWDRAAGLALAAETRPATLQRGVLTVEVRSTPLLAELEGFRREELLSKLLAAEPSGRITGLRFRLGVF